MAASRRRCRRNSETPGQTSHVRISGPDHRPRKGSLAHWGNRQTHLILDQGFSKFESWVSSWRESVIHLPASNAASFEAVYTHPCWGKRRRLKATLLVKKHVVFGSIPSQAWEQRSGAGSRPVASGRRQVVPSTGKKLLSHLSGDRDRT
jgi:hypothetical protein